MIKRDWPWYALVALIIAVALLWKMTGGNLSSFPARVRSWLPPNLRMPSLNWTPPPAADVSEYDVGGNYGLIPVGDALGGVTPSCNVCATQPQSNMFGNASDQAAFFADIMRRLANNG